MVKVRPKTAAKNWGSGVAAFVLMLIAVSVTISWMMPAASPRPRNQRRAVVSSPLSSGMAAPLDLNDRLRRWLQPLYVPLDDELQRNVADASAASLHRVAVEASCGATLWACGVAAAKVLAEHFSFSGTLLAAPGDGGPCVMMRYADSHGVDEWLRDGMDTELVFAACQEVRRPTLLLLSISDTDPVFNAKWSRALRIALERLVAVTPMLFVLSQSAAVDNTTGRLPLDGKLVLIPHYNAIRGDAPQQATDGLPGFNERPKKIVWRGSSTGLVANPVSGPRLLLRQRLGSRQEDPFWTATDRGQVMLALGNSTTQEADVGFTTETQQHVVPKTLLKPALQGVSSWASAGRVWLDVDGNSNSWESTRWKLIRGGVVLKIISSHGFVQWYYHRLRCGEHVICSRAESSAMKLHTHLDGVWDNESSFNSMSNAAKTFGEQHLTRSAARQYLRHVVAKCWENLDAHRDRDWRIHS